MSRRKKAIERQRKQNSPEKKAKIAKKNYYKSYEAKVKWDDKKEKKHQSQLNRRISQGIPVECPLRSWESPSPNACYDCYNLKCSFNTR